MRTAIVTDERLETYELGWVSFTPGETVTVVATAIGGPEARTLIRTSEGLSLHLEMGEDAFLEVQT